MKTKALDCTKRGIAGLLYAFGVKHSASTFIDEDTITYGYGKLSTIGEFQYPLPFFVTKRLGTSWAAKGIEYAS